MSTSNSSPRINLSAGIISVIFAITSLTKYLSFYIISITISCIWCFLHNICLQATRLILQGEGHANVLLYKYQHLLQLQQDLAWNSFRFRNINYIVLVWKSDVNVNNLFNIKNQVKPRSCEFQGNASYPTPTGAVSGRNTK